MLLITAGWGLSNVVVSWLDGSLATNTNEQEVDVNEEERETEAEMIVENVLHTNDGYQRTNFTNDEILDWRHSYSGSEGALQLFFNNVEYDLGIDGNTIDEELLEVIHHMSHQKVRAEHKVVAIPLTRDTLDQLNEAVHEKEDSKHEGLFRDIVEQWMMRNWTSFDQF